MKLNLVGGGYILRSPTAQSQVLVNLYPEVLQIAADAKNVNVGFLYGIPGRHVFKDLTTIDAAATPVRGIWTGDGRMFVAAGTKYFEINPTTGALIGSVRTISNATVFGFSNTPVQFFANGNQLFIVSGGVAYIDNGAGPVAITQADASGVGALFGTGLGYVSGDKFVDDGSWIGKTIVIHATNYTISGPGSPSPPFAPTQDQLYTTVAVVAPNPDPAAAWTVAGAQFPYTVVTGTWLDNSFWFNLASSRVAKFSNVNNGSVWNGLDFVTKDSWPDNILCIMADASQIYLWGTDSFEVWQANPGSTTNFFTRIDGASARIGTISPWCPISIDGHVYFIGNGPQGIPTAYVLDGFTPRRISQHGQEAVWYAAGLGPGCVSYTYTEEGHTFWVINFGTQAWAFDTTTGAWHRRAAGPYTAFTPYHTSYHAYVQAVGKHFTGGALDGKIYQSSVAFYDDAGSDIAWQRALSPLYNDRKRMYDHRLELELETGTAPSGTPVIKMDYSDDRGHTFGTSEDASIGTTNDFSTRVFWIALGSHYDRVYRLSGTSQGRVALIDAELDQSLGEV